MRTGTLEVTTYEPGDVVQLLTNGPLMTVLDVCDDCGDLCLGWFNQFDGSWQFEAIKVPPEAVRPAVTN